MKHPDPSAGLPAPALLFALPAFSLAPSSCVSFDTGCHVPNCMEKLSPGAGFWKQGAVREEDDAASPCGEGCQTSSNQRGGVPLDAGSREGFWQGRANGRT